MADSIIRVNLPKLTKRCISYLDYWIWQTIIMKNNNVVYQRLLTFQDIKIIRSGQ